MSSQRIGKYACLELERRYLLKSIPVELDESAPNWRITDRYLPDTRFRTRRMESVSKGEAIYKFTQKFQSETQDATQTTITNMYLNEEEYRRLEKLDGAILQKRRYRYVVQNHTYSIDVFEGRHQGLVLAEIEFEEESELIEFPAPGFVMMEVTAVHFFTGGHLATVSEQEFTERLTDFITS